MYPGFERLIVNNLKDAAVLAVKNEVDIIMPHTMPFFGVVRYVGNYPHVICYDHGEPSPDFFNESEARKNNLRQKTTIFSLLKICMQYQMQ